MLLFSHSGFDLTLSSTEKHQVLKAQLAAAILVPGSSWHSKLRLAYRKSKVIYWFFKYLCLWYLL